MALHFNISFNDLSFEMQEEIKESIRSLMKEELYGDINAARHEDGNELKTDDELSQDIWYQSFEDMIEEKTDEYINKNFYCRAEV